MHQLERAFTRPETTPTLMKQQEKSVTNARNLKKKAVEITADDRRRILIVSISDSEILIKHIKLTIAIRIHILYFFYDI